MKQRLTLLSFIVVISFLEVSGQVTVVNLRTELLNNPVGIDQREPRLSWELASSLFNVKQTHYQILVASTDDRLKKDEGDLWNSGKIASDQSVMINYAGKPLNSRQHCFWKVKIFTSKGNTSWSETAHWSMGLLNKSDWKAKWIGYDKGSSWDSITQFSRLSARYLRKEFQAGPGIKKASVYICGLGMYELFVNGEKISHHVLGPAPTDYRKSVLYHTYDVTKQLANGENVIGAVLGNGRFFTMRQNYKPAKINTFGYPKLLLQLEVEYNDGKKMTVISDESWKLNVNGPIRTNNEYDGEEYDATKELGNWTLKGYKPQNWISPQLVKAPPGVLVAQMNPPMRVMKTIIPKSITPISNDRYILDMGQNFSGWIKMRVTGKKGTIVTLRFAESLQPDGQLYIANLRDAKVTDKYTLKGAGTESWQPSFVYHGFRYVEVNGYPGKPGVSDFQGEFIYDDLPTTGSFSTSDSTINAIYKNAWWGIASNYKGMPVDCPQRNERQPWLGDRATGAGGEAFMFDNVALYEKWLDDIAQSQTNEGAIPDVAPAFWNYYSDNITWPGTYILVTDMLYRQYADKRSVIKHYPNMKKWMEYMKGKYLKNNILTKDKYGDWCVPPESPELIKSKDSLRITRGDLMATAYYYHFLNILQKFATISGKEADIKGYKELASEIKKAFNDRFLNVQKKLYDNNTVTANLLPLYLGIAPDSLREAIFNNVYNKIKIENHMHISTGVIGTQWLMRTLTDFQRSDIAYTLASNRDYPSWGYMVENGATTIWELWNGNTANPQMNSQNHVMLLGDLIIWFYQHLGGIKADNDFPGFKRIIMKPEIIDGLSFANTSYKSINGSIESNWHKNQSGTEFSWSISIPANTKAQVSIPAISFDSVYNNDSKLVNIEGVRFLQMDGQYAVFELGSGNYKLKSTYPFRRGILEDKFIFKNATFPESHSATIAETPEGLITAWFGGTKEGNKDVCIWTSRLVNDKWTDPVKVADGVLNDSTRYACYNPVLFQVPGGELLLFYKIGPNVAGWTGWMMRSSDHGKTWSRREALPVGFLGPIKNKPILIDGKLVCPSSTEKNGWRVHFEITPDFGKTWTKTEPLNDGKIITAIQPSILSYANGSLQILCRSKNRTINESWSYDRGKTWSAMQATNLPNNNSGTDAVTLKDGRQLLVYNHVKPAPELPNGKGARTPLNVAISKDGKTWNAALVLEQSPVSQYSYPAVIQTADGMVHIVYTWRRERIKYVKVDPSLLEQLPIINEQWPGSSNAVSKPSED